MGRSASDRAKELFAEDVVMNQYELFAELEERRLAAPETERSCRPGKFGSSTSVVYQAMSRPAVGKATASELEQVFGSLCEARSPLWRLLDGTTPSHCKGDLHLDLYRKHSFLP